MQIFRKGMQIKKLHIVLLTALLLSACRAAPTTITTEAVFTATAPSADRLLHTDAGDFVIGAARFVDEARGDRPGPNEKILLMPLLAPGGALLDPATFSLEAFQTAIHDTSKGEVHLQGDDGSYVISAMAGWVDDKATEFAIGFRVPAGAKIFTLFWPGNEPIEIIPEN